MKILLVSQNIQKLMHVSATLENQGHYVILATSNEDAFEQLHSAEFDLTFVESESNPFEKLFDHLGE